MNDDVRHMLEKCRGELCTRKVVGYMKSLSLGFGVKGESRSASDHKDYRLWEFGTYNCAWRVIRNGRVLCGSQNSADIAELNLILESVELGRFTSIVQTNELDIRINFDTGVAVDFITTFSDDDETLHIFVPEQRCIKFLVGTGWKVGPSDNPWPAEV